MLREQVIVEPLAARTVPESLALEPPSVLQRAIGPFTPEAIKQRHLRNAKAFPEQLASLWRQGREDFLHVLLHAFPDSMPLTREAGTPGEPTPQLITEGLTGRHVDLDLDR